uniref:Uncharacterized protein n=1 Tax=Solanum tuberosum TaxID=4113 RepID=M1DW70_SOLTU
MKVKAFIFPQDFMVLECEVDFKVPSSNGDHSLRSDMLIDLNDDENPKVHIEEYGIEALAMVIMNFDWENIAECKYMDSLTRIGLY